MALPFAMLIGWECQYVVMYMELHSHNNILASKMRVTLCIIMFKAYISLVNDSMVESILTVGPLTLHVQMMPMLVMCTHKSHLTRPKRYILFFVECITMILNWSIGNLLEDSLKLEHLLNLGTIIIIIWFHTS